MNKHVARVLSFSVVLFATALALAFPPQKGSGVLDEQKVLQLESVRRPIISPDGKHIVFTRVSNDMKNDVMRSKLWMVETDGSKISELTRGDSSETSPVWSPDGNRLAFLSNRDGTTQICVLQVESRELSQLTHLDRQPEELRWSPDGTKLAFTMFLPDEKSPLPITPLPRPKDAKWSRAPILVDRLSWRLDGRGFLPKGYSHIFVMDAQVGGTPRQVTSGDYSHNDPQWSPDGKRIYFSAIRKPEAEYQSGDSEIYSVDLSTLETVALTNRKGPDNTPRVSPDGKWIAYTGHDDKNYIHHIPDFYLMDLNGGRKRLLSSGFPSSPSSIQWAPDSSGLYYLALEKGEGNLYVASLTGNVTRVTHGIQVLGWGSNYYEEDAVMAQPELTIASNGQVATVRTTPQEPGHLVTFSLRSPDDVRTLVDLNGDILKDVKLSAPEELWFKAPDGLNLQGWLFRPPNFDPSKKYPMILVIHGGPHLMAGADFAWEPQFFAAKGYVVFTMNARGSTGYGQDFVRGNEYGYPGKDFPDLMAGVDAALAKGFIDEKNLFVKGGSAGGAATAWVVGHTNRFRAAAALYPVIDWISMVGTTDGGGRYRGFRKYPWDDPLEYLSRSPLYYVGSVTTPTLIMTGENDLRCQIGQSEEFYRALKTLKKETLLIRMPEEGHNWSRPSHILEGRLYILAWFEKFRTDRSHTNH